MRFLIVAAALLLGAAPALAADLQVLTAGAYKSVLLAVAPAFEKESGHRLILQNDTAGGVAQRIAQGQVFDLAVLTGPTAAGPLAAGKLANPLTPVASVGIGVAVKGGAPKPEIGNLAGFKAALLAARAVAIVDPASGGSSGIHMIKVFDTMGIAAEMRAKLVLVPGGLAAERLLNGEADLAIQQESELLAVSGVVVAGPVPAEVQARTVYVAGMPGGGSLPARALLAFLTGPAGRAALALHGMTEP